MSLAHGTGTAKPQYEDATRPCPYRMHVCVDDGPQGPERQVCETFISLL